MKFLRTLILAGCLGLTLGGTALAETYVLRVATYGDADVGSLINAGYVIDHVDATSAEVFASPDQFATLRASGRPYTLIEIQGQGYAKDINAGTGLGTYVSFDTLTQILEDYADTYSNICSLTSLGTSVQGREIWALRVTDNPGIEEAEPEFKYVATMHGDEPIGTVLLLYLLDEMLPGYGTVDRFTNLINETDLWFVPLMNPDGYMAIQRYNANGQDLNRDFPVFGAQYTGTVFDGEALLTNGREPETVALMNWTAANSFVMSSNMHSGEIVMNYPYDYVPGIQTGSYAAAPDDDLLIDLATVYASQNADMMNNPSFPGGITNGSDWYAVADGMQDWNYRYAGNIEMTLELNKVKRPSESALPGLWDDNRESLIQYMEAVHRGIRGIVTNAGTDAPIYAEISIEGNTQPVFTDPDVGDYYRLLLPGTYTVTCDAAGYNSMTFEGATVTEGVVTVLDFPLQLSMDPTGDGLLDAVDVQYTINAALGVGSTQGADVNGDTVVDAVDVQLVINGVLN